MRVLLTGGRGMLGRALTSALEGVLPPGCVDAPSRADLDLLDGDRVRQWLESRSYDIVIHAAGRVGGIADNVAQPSDYLLDNVLQTANLLKTAVDMRVPAFLNIGSSCMYPKDYRQPLLEGDILAAKLEPTNEGYGIAKIMGERGCAYAASQHGLAYRTIIPSNLYGPFDHFEPRRAHLIAAALRKVHEAKAEGRPEVVVWGDGSARREFTFVDDVARWIATSLRAIESLPQTMNVGCGYDHSVDEYYAMVGDVVGYTGRFVHDDSKPSGMRQKLMDSSVAAQHGWRASTSLAEGIRRTYDFFLSHHERSADLTSDGLRAGRSG